VHGAHLGVGLVFDAGLAKGHGVSFQMAEAPPVYREEPRKCFAWIRLPVRP
jgi:hypothetical protein